MIILDENLDEQRVRKPLAARYKGHIVSLRELRPGTVIKDDALPEILCGQKNPVFVTTNVEDFWRKVLPHRRYCIICLPLPNERQDEIPDLLLRFLRYQAFDSMAKRMGKIFRVNCTKVVWYEVNQGSLIKLAW